MSSINHSQPDKTRIAQPQTIKPASKRIKEDFSMVQVIASALSAATSMLLAPKIGVIGGILGVAIGAAVAAIVSQVYKSILKTSAEKLKANLALEQQIEDERPEAFDKTTVITPHTSTPIAPTKYSIKAQKEQKQNKIIILLVVVAITLAAVGLTAHLITKFTKGEGLGNNPQPILVVNTPQEPQTQDTGLPQENVDTTTTEENDKDKEPGVSDTQTTSPDTKPSEEVPEKTDPDKKEPAEPSAPDTPQEPTSPDSHDKPSQNQT